MTGESLKGMRLVEVQVKGIVGRKWVIREKREEAEVQIRILKFRSIYVKRTMEESASLDSIS